MIACAAGCVVACGVASCVAPAAARAQTPAQPPARPDSAARDSARGAARADSVRRAPSDSTQRDSVIARQLRRDGLERDPVYRRFTPDRLRLAGVGAAAGYAFPDQVNVTPLSAVHADYGALARDLRVIFGVSYWSSHFRDAAVRGFERAIAAAVQDPSGGATVRVGRVRASDVALNADLRWRPGVVRRLRLPSDVRPWLGGGLGVHLLDVEGAPISGTFVERSLDGVAFGGALALGADAQFFSHLQFTAQGRYDLFNGAHYASLRAGATYLFDRRGRL